MILSSLLMCDYQGSDLRDIFLYKANTAKGMHNIGAQKKIISIFHGCMVWIEKSVTRVTDRHHLPRDADQ